MHSSSGSSLASESEERNHQGKENLILFPTQTEARKKKDGAVRCRERLGGLLKYYEREAA
jgi:putative transposase